MPARVESLRVTDAYRAQFLALRQRAALIIQAQWRLVHPGRVFEAFPVWQAAAAATLTEAQRLARAQSAAYFAAYATSETGRPVPIPPVPAGTEQPALALAPALITIRAKLKGGADIQTALDSGLRRAVRGASDDLTGASRTALDVSMRSSGIVVGYRRVASGAGCGACLAAATGAIQASDVTLPVHSHCRCTKEPVIRDVPDRARRATGQELYDALGADGQDALVGADAAGAIRSGAAPFGALIAPGPDGLTQAAQVAVTNRSRR